MPAKSSEDSDLKKLQKVVNEFIKAFQAYNSTYRSEHPVTLSYRKTVLDRAKHLLKDLLMLQRLKAIEKVKVVAVDSDGKIKPMSMNDTLKLMREQEGDIDKFLLSISTSEGGAEK